MSLTCCPTYCQNCQTIQQSASHSHTLYQFPQELRNRLSSQIAELSRGRNLFEISFEWWRGKEQPLLELGRIRNGNREEEVLAYCNPHGEWLQWVHKGQL